MNLRQITAKVWGRATPAQRKLLINLVERMPGFGSKRHYGRYGEDAFLQAYFREQVHQTSEEIKLPAYFRRSVSSGFYVDIGALAPVYASNTYWFYKRGWSGINIDAAPGSMKAFRQVRTRDVNLETLISDTETERVFFYWESPSSVNTVIPEFAKEWSRRYGREPQKIILQPRRLDDVLKEHLPPDQKISFMTIDVEGHELFVLRSNDWNRFRPELVLVEVLMRTIDELVGSEIHHFMKSIGYYLYAWIRPTVVYRQIGCEDAIVHDFFAEFTISHF